MEVIASMNAAYKSLEIGNFQVKFNDRKLVDQALTTLKISKSQITDFMRTLDKLDKIGEKKVKESLAEQGFAENLLPEYSKLMDKLSKDRVIEIQNMLSGLGVEQMKFDKFLMRGLDYYTGIVFEFILLEKPEFGSVGRCCRYGELVEKTTGINTPAVGGSIGLDRLFSALEEMGDINPRTAGEVKGFNMD